LSTQAATQLTGEKSGEPFQETINQRETTEKRKQCQETTEFAVPAHSNV